MRAVLAAAYHELRAPLPLSFALGEGPIVVPLRALEWGRFEQVVHRMQSRKVARGR